ncbi:MAG: TonB-dependent receptor [Treponema sp.]|jgi:vitamin B12 transporter|nr:TonB-dependent receptor [Treponema sp.]
MGHTLSKAALKMTGFFLHVRKFFPVLLLLFFLLLTAAADTQDVFEDDGFLFVEDEGITVVGTAQTSQQMAVIERDEIERRGAADIVNLLHETLGLNIVRYGAYGNQAGVNLRGFDSKRIAFLINGAPVDSAMDGKFDINQIDINSIERIEVIYGGSDSKYNVSGAFGGVVNIITVKKQEPGLRLGFSVSNTSSMPGKYRDRAGETQNPHLEDLFDTQNYSFSLSYGGGAFSLTANIFANRAENHFIFTDYVGRLRRKDNNEVWDSGASASTVWELPNMTKLIASSAFYYGDRNFPSSGFSSNVGYQQDFSSRQNLMVDAPRAFRDDLAAEASLSWQFNRLDYTSSADEFSRHDQNSLLAVNRWNWFPVNWLTLRSGIDYRYISLDSTEIGSRNRHDGGFYLTAEFQPLEQFLLIPSAKVIFTSDRGADAEVIPKLGLLWNVTDNFDVRNNYFRSFKFPDFEELYWTGGGGFGNPDLCPEDGWGADFGAEWRITESLTAESVFFTQWIKDSIHWFSGSGGIWRPENVGEAVLFGLDSKISFEFKVSTGPVKKITAAFSYQYLLSYLLSYGYTFADSKQIPYNPEHTIGGSLDISWEGGSLLISGQYESLRYHDTANLTTLKPVFLLNAAVNQKISENLSVFCALRNILNVSYESFYNYPMPGFTLTLGLRVNMEMN